MKFMAGTATRCTMLGRLLLLRPMPEGWFGAVGLPVIGWRSAL